MHIRSIVVGVFVAGSSLHAAVISTTSDLLYVVGSGANLATLVIDFNDGSGSESFAWGYRWDGQASGADMLIAIAAADPGMTVQYFGTGDSGFYLTQIDYLGHSQSNGDFVSNFDYWGYYVSGGFAGGTLGNPDLVPGGGSTLPGSWLSSPSGAGDESFGITGRPLTDGSWDLWSFGPYSETYSGGAPIAAVPEPSVTLSFIAGLGLLLRRKRR